MHWQAFHIFIVEQINSCAHSPKLTLSLHKSLIVCPLHCFFGCPSAHSPNNATANESLILEIRPMCK